MITGQGILLKIKYFITERDARTSLAMRNIFSSFGLKFFDILIELLLVPLSLAYLTQASYGLWLTIYSLVNWFNFFDLGMSHGYRNKLAIALSNNDIQTAKKYTSTVYILIGMISLLSLIIGLFLVPLFDWTNILNAESVSRDLLTTVIILLVINFSLNLTCKIISSVFLAKQMPMYSNLINSITKLVIFLGIGALWLFGKENLLLYASIYLCSPLLILFGFSIYYFKGEYADIKPSVFHFDKTKINDLLGLGGKFFIIQIGVTMLFMSDNLIITKLLGPAEVAPYQVAHKYFGIALLIFSILMTPFWSAITDAYSKGDYHWIENIIRKLNYSWLGISAIVLIMLLIFQPVLNLWVGNEIKVSFILALQWAIFVLLQTYNQIYTFFLNGTGKLSIQMWSNVFTLIMNIPLSIYFAKNLGLGSAGVILATNISILLYVILRKIQYNKIINGTAKGIWAS